MLTPEDADGLERSVNEIWSPLAMNGRQIGNCILGAVAIAEVAGERLAQKHFQEVIDGMEWDAAI